MEARYSKEEILTIYLNRAYLGAGTRGFEAAAQRYFGVGASEVTPAEAAMLAGPPQGALDLCAHRQPRARARPRHLVVGLMEAQGYLDAAQARRRARPRRELSPQAARARAGPSPTG
jgi:membrane peptidoglycan carboxypeptidase